MTEKDREEKYNDRERGKKDEREKKENDREREKRE